MTSTHFSRQRLRVLIILQRPSHVLLRRAVTPPASGWENRPALPSLVHPCIPRLCKHGCLFWVSNLEIQAQLLWLPVICKFQTGCISFLFSTPFGTSFPLKKAPEVITDTSRTRFSFTIFGITQFHSHTSTQRLTGQWHRTELIAISKPPVQTAFVKLFQFKFHVRLNIFIMQ